MTLGVSYYDFSSRTVQDNLQRHRLLLLYPLRLLLFLLKLKVICKGLKCALDEAKQQYNSYKM